MDVRGKAVNFDVPRDLAASDVDFSYKQWKDAFLSADYVWYVFRADLVAADDADTLEGVKEHLDRFKAWMDQGKSVRPKVILIGTFAELSPQFEDDFAGLVDTVRSAAPIKLGMVKLHNAGLVVGSLLAAKDAKKLVKRISSSL